MAERTGVPLAMAGTVGTPSGSPTGRSGAPTGIGSGNFLNSVDFAKLNPGSARKDSRISLAKARRQSRRAGESRRAGSPGAPAVEASRGVKACRQSIRSRYPMKQGGIGFAGKHPDERGRAQPKGRATDWPIER